MARSVRDVALLLQVIAGYDPLDAGSVDVPTDDYLEQIESGVSGWRVALASDVFFTELTDPNVWKAVQDAALVFRELGAVVEEVSFPEARRAALANGLMTTSDGAAFHRERLQSQAECFGEDILQRLQTGAAYTSTDYSLARQTQVELRRQFTGFFESTISCSPPPRRWQRLPLKPERRRAGASADPLHCAVQPDRAACAVTAVWFYPCTVADWFADHLPTVGRSDRPPGWIRVRASVGVVQAPACRARLSCP